MSRIFFVAIYGSISYPFAEEPFWSCSSYLLIIGKLLNDLRVPEVTTPHFLVLGIRL